MQRTMLGVLAGLFLIAAAALYWFDESGGERMLLIGMSMRIGLVLGAIWLAYEHLDVLPRVLLGLLVVVALVIAIMARSKGLMVALIGAVCLLAILRALKRRVPTSTARRDSEQRDRR